MPPLGLLAGLACGTPAGDDRPARRMLAEHQAIVAALKVLADAADDEDKPEAARFAEKLILHARTEEEVSYPTAILVGRYPKLAGAR